VNSLYRLSKKKEAWLIYDLPATFSYANLIFRYSAFRVARTTILEIEQHARCFFT